MKTLVITLVVFSLFMVFTPEDSFAMEVFLHVPNVKGETIDQKYRDWIGGIQSVSWGHQQATVSTSGGGAGRVQFSPLTIIKAMDSASVPLARMCAMGQVVKEVFLEFRSSAQAREPFMTVRLIDVIVVDYKVAVPQGLPLVNIARPQETVAFQFSKIEWSYRPQDAKGGVGPEIKGGVDVRDGKVF
jgi:type VI secretion system secreted protein Hcp